NGKFNDNLGDGSFGAPKRVLSLRGVKDTAPWAWNGSMTELESQVRKSILTTMHGDKPTDERVTELAEFLKTLPPPPPAIPSVGKADAEAIERGRELFTKLGCAACHAPGEYTSR